MDDEGLASAARQCLDSAIQHSFNIRKDEHWCGELRSNATITAEYVFLYQALGLSTDADKDALCRYLLSQQKPDGSWANAPGHPGDVSTTTEAYLALKLLGTSSEDPRLQLARQFILRSGGIEKVRVLTRFYLATFGLWPWSSVPEVPAELILVNLRPSPCRCQISYIIASDAKMVSYQHLPTVILGAKHLHTVTSH